MEELLEKVDDRRMLRILRLYRRHPYKVLARYMARMFHRSSHDKIVDLLQEMIVEAAKTYPKRRLQTDEKVRYEKLRKKAEMRKMNWSRRESEQRSSAKNHLKRSGIRLILKYIL